MAAAANPRGPALRHPAIAPGYGSTNRWRRPSPPASSPAVPASSARSACRRPPANASDRGRCVRPRAAATSPRLHGECWRVRPYGAASPSGYQQTTSARTW
ncbi:hypothetical protein G6F68_017619 [Rhizopus microsporus]|nr:hypothetical protein G6F24_018701 [Rhizopus arrhizus]KAG1240481.1 hypothetical protein G6F68_017619 [Rhizopus microsporus]